MKFEKTITILYLTDIQRSIDYYMNVLGFDDSWIWKTPPTFGGICKDAVEIFFCLKGQGNKDTWQSIIAG